MSLRQIIRDIEVNISETDNGDTSLGSRGNDESQIVEYMNEFILRYQNLIIGIYVLIALTLVIVFIVGTIRLAGSGSNPIERRRAVISLLITLGAIAFLGSMGVVFALVFNIFG